MSIQPSIGRLVESFGPLMGRRTFAKFSVLLLVWSLAPQRRTVTELIKTLRSLERRQRRLEHGHHSSYHTGTSAAVPLRVNPCWSTSTSGHHRATKITCILLL